MKVVIANRSGLSARLWLPRGTGGTGGTRRGPAHQGGTERGYGEYWQGSGPGPLSPDVNVGAIFCGGTNGGSGPARSQKSWWSARACSPVVNYPPLRQLAKRALLCPRQARRGRFRESSPARRQWRTGLATPPEGSGLRAAIWIDDRLRATVGTSTHRGARPERGRRSRCAPLPINEAQHPRWPRKMRKPCGAPAKISCASGAPWPSR